MADVAPGAPATIRVHGRRTGPVRDRARGHAASRSPSSRFAPEPARPRDRRRQGPAGPGLALLLGRRRRPRPLVPRARRALEAAAARASRGRDGRCPPGSSASSARARSASSLGALSAGLLALVFLTALIGEPSSAQNLAPTFVYIVFWLGLVPVQVLFGNVWPVLNPWLAVANGVAWLWRRLGQDWTPPLDYPRAARRLARRGRCSSASRRSSSPTPSRRARARSRSRSRSTATRCGSGWPPSAGGRGTSTATASPSTSGCSRGSRRSASTTAGSSSGCRSPGSPAPSGRRGCSPSSPSCSARSGSTGSAARRSGRTCAPTSRGRTSSTRRGRRSCSRPGWRSPACSAASSLVALAYLGATRIARADGRVRAAARAGVPAEPRADRARLRRRALLHGVHHPGPVHLLARVRPLRVRLGSLRDGDVLAEHRPAVAEHRLVRPGRRARRRPRRGPRGRARPRGHDPAGSGTRSAPSTPCWG